MSRLPPRPALPLDRRRGHRLTTRPTSPPSRPPIRDSARDIGAPTPGPPSAPPPPAAAGVVIPYTGGPLDRGRVAQRRAAAADRRHGRRPHADLADGDGAGRLRRDPGHAPCRSVASPATRVAMLVSRCRAWTWRAPGSARSRSSSTRWPPEAWTGCSAATSWTRSRSRWTRPPARDAGPPLTGSPGSSRESPRTPGQAEGRSRLPIAGVWSAAGCRYIHEPGKFFIHSSSASQ